MVSRIRELAEEARVAIRNVRRDANKHADTAEKEKTLSEDDSKATKEQVQELTKKYEGIVNEKAASREKEVMEN
ncbi:MAG UNVERIFIED_CONTAM: ribosome recycling factor [Planctomycetaceae bacterium]|jgi:ribosome recycling factor